MKNKTTQDIGQLQLRCYYDILRYCMDVQDDATHVQLKPDGVVYGAQLSLGQSVCWYISTGLCFDRGQGRRWALSLYFFLERNIVRSHVFAGLVVGISLVLVYVMLNFSQLYTPLTDTTILPRCQTDEAANAPKIGSLTIG